MAVSATDRNTPFYDRRSPRLVARAGFSLFAAMWAGAFFVAMIAGSRGGWSSWHWFALGVVAILTSGSLACYALAFLIEAPHQAAARARAQHRSVAVSQCPTVAVSPRPSPQVQRLHQPS